MTNLNKNYLFEGFWLPIVIMEEKNTKSNPRKIKKELSQIQEPQQA